MRVALAELPQSSRRIDIVFELLMGALCVFTPLAFGTVEAWSQEIFLALIAALVLCYALQKFMSPPEPTGSTWAFVPVALFLAFCLIQLLPMPAGVVRAFSAGTLQIKSGLLADLPNASSFLQRTSITFYAAASREELRLLIGLAAVFVMVVGYYRTPSRIGRLLLVIACIGLGVACLAFYQNLSGADTIYGLVPATQKDSGPFICHSHFAQFMNLSVGAASGLLLVRWLELCKRQEHSSDLWEALREPCSSMIWLLATICVLVPIAMFLSLARMGTISLLIAGGVTGAVLVWKTRFAGRASLVAAMGIVILAVLLASGFDTVYDRLATVRHVELVDGGRIQMLKDMTAEFKLFPLVGTGLGTHEFVFPMFDHSNIPSLATHAENEYAQLLEECGIIGALLAVWFAVSIGVSFWKIIRLPTQPIQYAAFGLGLGLLAILIHSASDFGQHVPANALLTAIFSGLLINLSRMSGKKSISPKIDHRIGQPSFGWHQLLTICGSLAVVAILASVIWSADKSRQAESAWNQAYPIQADLEQKAWQGSNEEYALLLAPAAAAAKLVPDNVTYGYWLNVYRWRSITRVTDANTRAVLFTPRSIDYAGKISDQLQSLRPLCPTFGPPLCVSGQIEDFVLHRPLGSRHIEQAFRLTPYDRTVCFVAGKLAVSEKNWDQSRLAFRRCESLGGFDSEIADTYIEAGHPELAMQVFAGKRQPLEYLADRLKGISIYQDIFQQCHDQALSLLLAEVNEPGASPQAMAELATRAATDRKFADAASWYQKALDLNYSQVDWRISLARVLADMGRVSQAMEQAKICIRLRPQSDQAQKLIADLALRKDADHGLVGDAARQSAAADTALGSVPSR